MDRKQFDSPHEANHQRHVAVRAGLDSRGSKLQNVWVFESPKNKKRFILNGDAKFMHCVLLEGNTDIEGYNPDPESISVSIQGKESQINISLHIYYKDGRDEIWRLNDSDESRGDMASSQLISLRSTGLIPDNFKDVSSRTLQGKEILFDNWLTLCSLMSRARNYFAHKEFEYLQDRFRRNELMTVRSLLEIPDVDIGLMQALIAKGLQSGTLFTDLETKLFGLNSVLSRSST